MAATQQTGARIGATVDSVFNCFFHCLPPGTHHPAPSGQQAVPVIDFYLLYGLIGRVSKNWLLPLARPRAQEPGDYTSYLQSSGKCECSETETDGISPTEKKIFLF